MARDATHVERILGSSEDFADMAIVARDGASVSCHRVVLASCSGFLHSLLADTDEAVLMLPEATVPQLQQLLSLAYRGQTECGDRAEADAMLAMAARLGMDNVNECADANSDAVASAGVGVGAVTLVTSRPASGDWQPHSHRIDEEGFLANAVGSYFVAETNLSWTWAGHESSASTHGHDHDGDGDATAAALAFPPWPVLQLDKTDLLACGAAEENSTHVSTVDKTAILYPFSGEPRQSADDSALLHWSCQSQGSPEGGDSSWSDSSGAGVCVTPVSDEENCRRKFACSVCHQRFRSRHYLRLHESTAHESPAAKCECEACGKTFSGEYYLRQHRRRMHSSTRAFACDRCPSSFGIKYDLVVHLRTHAAVKQFECAFCGKTYATQRARREHLRTHTGERPFACSECGKRFALPKTLRVHFRQHSGERPYLCSHCGRTFVQNSTLRNHLRHNHSHSAEAKTKLLR